MKIKPGATPGVDATSAARPTDGPRAAEGFDALQGPDGAKARPTADPVTAAVDEVAASVARGEVSRGEPAVHAVIERIVRQFVDGPDASARVEEACRMLGSDPNFVTRVERMLDRSLASSAT